MLSLKVHNNTQYSKRVTIPSAILKALNNPKEFILTLENDSIILKPKRKEEN
jgi:hypothetical protein